MKNAILYFILIFMCILIIGTSPSISRACSCVEIPGVKEEFARSKAVFSGKVIDKRENRNSNGYSSTSVLFAVTNTWKGVHQSQIIITTGHGGGDCGFDFSVGQEYLVYANQSTMYGSKSLVTVICDRTNVLSSSMEDLKFLGSGKHPTEKVDFTNSFKGNLFFLWIAVFIAIGVIVLFLFKRRKKVE